MEKIKRTLKALEKKVLPRKEKSTFIKDPLESVMVHIGNLVDKTSLAELVDIACMVGLGAFNCLIHDDQADYLGAFDFFIGASTWKTLTTPHKSEAIGVWGVTNMTAISLNTALKQAREAIKMPSLVSLP